MTAKENHKFFIETIDKELLAIGATKEAVPNSDLYIFTPYEYLIDTKYGNFCIKPAIPFKPRFGERMKQKNYDITVYGRYLEPKLLPPWIHYKNNWHLGYAKDTPSKEWLQNAATDIVTAYAKL